MPNYLDHAQRSDILRLRQTFAGRTQWPTWLLLSGVYSSWFGLMLASNWLGVSVTTLLMIPVVVLWMSVQHELLHGHPTRWLWLNKALGYAPFALWYPYTLYRETHLAHHCDDDLTLPGLDPESRYLSQQHWLHTSLIMRSLRWLDKTMPGRIVFGAPIALLALAGEVFVQLRRGDKHAWQMWLTHGAFALLMFWFIARFSALPVWHYVLLITVPALSVSMVRSYYEHRPTERPEQRTVINEAAWIWSWLFLHLNLHLVHHDLPGLPWYFLPRVYRARREQWLARSGGFLVRGYGELFRRHSLSAIDSPQHPYV